MREWLSLQAHKVCPSDPLACNELGVLTYRNHQYAASERWLLRALELVPGRLHAGKLHAMHRHDGFTARAVRSLKD